MPIKPIITSEQRKLHQLNTLLREFRDINSNISVHVVQTFLLVCVHEGCSLADILKITGWHQSTISRFLLDLGPKLRDGSPGYGLVQSERDPTELRKNIYTLTPKGRELKRKVLDLIDSIER